MCTNWRCFCRKKIALPIDFGSAIHRACIFYSSKALRTQTTTINLNLHVTYLYVITKKSQFQIVLQYILNARFYTIYRLVMARFCPGASECQLLRPSRGGQGGGACHTIHNANRLNIAECKLQSMGCDNVFKKAEEKKKICVYLHVQIEI